MCIYKYKRLDGTLNLHAQRGAQRKEHRHFMWQCRWGSQATKPDIADKSLCRNFWVMRDIKVSGNRSCNSKWYVIDLRTTKQSSNSNLFSFSVYITPTHITCYPSRNSQKRQTLKKRHFYATFTKKEHHTSARKTLRKPGCKTRQAVVVSNSSSERAERTSSFNCKRTV